MRWFQKTGLILLLITSGCSRCGIGKSESARSGQDSRPSSSAAAVVHHNWERPFEAGAYLGTKI